MKYDVASCIRFACALIFALLLVFITAFYPIDNLFADLVIRFGGTAMIFLLGFIVGLCIEKDGADNER